MKIVRMCLNWKVLAALAAVGVGVWAVAPNLISGLLPVLLVAACPLSMLVMMRGMQGDRGETRSEQESRSASASGTKDRRLAELKAELSNVRGHQEAIARQIAQLEITESADLHSRGAPAPHETGTAGPESNGERGEVRTPTQ
jgi:hypothetical protein